MGMLTFKLMREREAQMKSQGQKPAVEAEKATVTRQADEKSAQGQKPAEDEGAKQEKGGQATGGKKSLRDE